MDPDTLNAAPSLDGQLAHDFALKVLAQGRDPIDHALGQLVHELRGAAGAVVIVVALAPLEFG